MPTPCTLSDRAFAPDLARGFMLLAIAIANAPLFVRNTATGAAWANQISELGYLTLIANQARPMFVFLFGYGLTQWFLRESARGGQPEDLISTLRRRSGWLIVIGFAHAIVLAPIDIVAVYGLASLVLVSMLRADDATLWWSAGLLLLPAITAVSMTWQLIATGQLDFETVAPPPGQDFSATMDIRAKEWPLNTVVAAFSVVPGILVGMWAARHRILEEPHRHRRLLVRTCVVTLPISVAGAVPSALLITGLWSPASSAVIWAASFSQPLTGYAGGVAAAGLAGLIALRPSGTVTSAIAAAGRRSLSIYLAMSVVFVAVFFPVGLNWSDAVGHATATLVAIATWAGLLALATLWQHLGWRGPAETLLRWLTGGPPARLRRK